MGDWDMNVYSWARMNASTMNFTGRIVSGNSTKVELFDNQWNTALAQYWDHAGSIASKQFRSIRPIHAVSYTCFETECKVFSRCSHSFAHVE
jgi:hypothetical protein